MTAIVGGLALLLLPAAAGMQARAGDALQKYYFTVELEGLAVGGFREVSGLSAETEVVEFRDGSDNLIRKLPGRTKWPDIVLKKGFTGSTELFDWAMTLARTGTVVRRSGSIVMYDQSHTEIARWRFENAWPVKWEGPTLKAGGNEVAMETLVLAHEGFRRDDDGDDR
jgi:phage tail-like protein